MRRSGCGVRDAAHGMRRTGCGATGAAQCMQADHAEFVERLRSHTGRGRPLGTDRFLGKVEKLLGRRVRPLPVGRCGKPKKRGKKQVTVPIYPIYPNTERHRSITDASRLRIGFLNRNFRFFVAASD